MDYYKELQELPDNEIEDIINQPDNYEDDIIIDAMQIGFERGIINNHQEDLCNRHLKRNELKSTMVISSKKKKENTLTSNDELEKKLVEKANTTLALGIISLLLGLMVTIITYISASQHGGRYYITFGAITFGLGYSIKGLVYRIRIRKTFKNKN